MSSEGIPRSEVELLLKAQQTAFEGFLRSFMDSVNTRIDSVLTQVVEVKTSIASITQRLDNLSTKDGALTVAVDSLEAKFKELELHTDYLENQSRRNNLRIDGVAEDPNESWAITELKVKDTLVTALGFTTSEAENIKVERAHRTGKNLPLHHSRAPGGSTNHSARSIIVKFNSYKDRDAILRRCKERQPTGLYVNEDFSKRVSDIRRHHQTALKQYRDQGKVAFLSFDKLIVRDQASKTVQRDQREETTPKVLESSS